MSLIVRPFTSQDADACARLIDQNQADMGDLYTAQELIQSASYTQYHVADNDGVVVGLIGLNNLKNGIGMLATTCVDPAQHGHGIGTKLLQFMIQLGKKQNYRKLLLLTHEQNKAMMILAIKQGFIPEGSLKKHFRDGKDVIYFSYFYH